MSSPDKKLWSASNLGVKELGAFSFISFLKTTNAKIDSRELDILSGFPRADHAFWPSYDRLDSDDSKLFDKMTDLERKEMILRQAVDLHESHHFHSILLVPIGRVLIELLLLRLQRGPTVLAELGDLLRADDDPFQDPVTFLDSSPDSILSYLFDGIFPGVAYNVDNAERSYPAARATRFDTGPVGANGPAVHLGGKDYPIGLRTVLEGWTESLIRALVFQSRPSEYFDWYESTRKSESLWVYGLIERVLEDIFGASYARLDPLERYCVVSHISICACQMEKPDEVDVFAHRGNHPGWRFLTICDRLWSTRDMLVVNGRLDVNRLIRSGNRFEAIIRSKGGASFVKDVTTLREQLQTPAPSGFSALFFRHYLEYREQVVSLFLEHREVFYDATEWLNCFKRKLLPSVPIMIAPRPDQSRPVPNFPDEKNTQFWWTWFMYSQLLDSMVDAAPSCPIVRYDLEAGCPRDEACCELKLSSKDDRCHLRRLLLAVDN